MSAACVHFEVSVALHVMLSQEQQQQQLQCPAHVLTAFGDQHAITVRI